MKRGFFSNYVLISRLIALVFFFTFAILFWVVKIQDTPLRDPSEWDHPEEVINAYMEALDAKKYDVAYTYLSTMYANKPSKKEYIEFGKNVFDSVKLLSIQSLADWQAENNYRVVKDPENIQRFWVKYEVRYQEGRYAAAPEGIWDRVFVMVREESRWRILSVDTVATSSPYSLPTMYPSNE